MKHKNRLERLEQQMGSGDDDTTIVIRLVWPEQEPVKPIVKHGENAAGGVTVRWPHDAT